MNPIKYLVVSCLSALAVLGSASAARADNYSIFMPVVSLVAIDDEYILYTENVPNNATNNPAGCSAGTGIYYFNVSQTTAAGAELMTRTMLAAFLAGRKVQLWVESNPSNGGCVNNSPTFYRVAVDKDDN